MAWSISITPEGWQDIRRELETWDRERIIAALADDEYERVEDEMAKAEFGGFDPDAPAINALNRRKALERLDLSDLVDAAMETIEANNTCDNGGFRYWIDREGYHGVTLS